MNRIAIISEETVFDAFDHSMGQVIVEAEKIYPQGSNVIIDVVYYSLVDNIKLVIKRKSKTITKEQYNQLYTSVPSVLLEDLDEFSKDIVVKQYALLSYVQNDFIFDEKTIFNLDSNQWSIYEDEQYYGRYEEN